jgi:hypothetical protein
MRFYTKLAGYASDKEILNKLQVVSNNNVNILENQQSFTPSTFSELLKLWEDVQTKNPTTISIEFLRNHHKKDATIYSLVDRYASTKPIGNKIGDLSKIVTQYWLYNFVQTSPEETNILISSGLGFVLEDPQRRQQPEPAVLKAIINWFRDKNESLTYHYASQHSHLNPVAFGGIFDNIVAFCFLEKYGTILEDIPLFKQTQIPFLTRAFQLQALRLEKRNLNDYIQFDNSSFMVCC